MGYDYSKYLDEKKKMNKTLKRIIWIAVILVIGFMVFSGISKSAKKKAEAAKRAQEAARKFAVPVEVEKVSRESIIETLDTNGDIEGIESVNLYADYSGKVTSVYVAEGSPVRKGQTLAAMNRDVVVQRFEDYPIKALIGGIVGKIYLKKGDTVTPALPVISVVNVEKVKCIVNLIEKDLSKVRPGQEAEIRVDAYPSVVFKGKIFEISPVLDPMSRSSEVTLQVENFRYPETPLKPGMYASVKINIGRQDQALLIPYSSILKEDSGKAYIFVSDQNKAKKVYINPGFIKNYGSDTTKDKISVTGEIREGEFVVFMGHHFLNQGDKIRFTYDGKKYEPSEDQEK